MVAGDTFESIARKKYGVEIEAGRIARANPGAAEPLTAGVVLTIPPLPSAPSDKPSAPPAQNPDEVTISIDGERFRFWDRVRVTRSMDSISTVEFGAPFEPDQQAFRDAFKPLSFKPVGISIGGTLQFSGTEVSINPSLENDRRVVSVGAYGLPGVLNDCTPSANAFPLEFNGQGLREVSSTLAGPFGLRVDFEANQGAIFERIALAPGKKVLPFLIDLAQQRNLVISDTPEGALLFRRSAAVGSPVARLVQGASPVLSVEPQFNPQAYYSHVTGISPIRVGYIGSKYTAKNELLSGAVRPFVFTVGDTLDADTESAAKAKLSRMFANMASYDVSVNTWRDPQGELWQENTTLTLQAPGAMVYNEYEFIIRSVSFDKVGDAKTAVLNLVLPGAFSGEAPEALPWDE